MSQCHNNKQFSERTSAGFMFRTFVIRPCMIRKWGLLTFNWTERNRSWTRELVALQPLMRYLLRPPTTTWQRKRRHKQSKGKKGKGRPLI